MVLLGASLTAAHGAAFNLDNVCSEASSATANQIAGLRRQVLAEVAQAESEVQAAESSFAQARQRLQAFRDNDVEPIIASLADAKKKLETTPNADADDHRAITAQLDALLWFAHTDILVLATTQQDSVPAMIETLWWPMNALVTTLRSTNADRAAAQEQEDATKEAAGAALACLKKREATFANAGEQELAYLQAKATELTATFRGHVQQLQAMIKASFEGKQPNPAQEARIKRELKSTGEALLKVVAQVQEKGGKVSADTQQMVQAYQSFRAKL
ncbi:MAG: hypothetical protein KDJ68_02880 [Rhodobiaceae bacterium]|nr:hypothetical protein [Rhodobiaceae bacterium]